jgi:hypothetical protein
MDPKKQNSIILEKGPNNLYSISVFYANHNLGGVLWKITVSTLRNAQMSYVL